VPWLDGPVALAAVMEHSGKMTLATTVALSVVRGPVPVAKTLGAIDRLSGGRLVVAVGPGSSADDYAAVGLDFSERWQRFDESISALRALWRTDGTRAGTRMIRDVNSIRKGTRVIYVRDNTDVALLKMKAPLATYIEFENSADAFAALKAGQGDVFTQVVTHLFRAASHDPSYAVVARFTDKPYYVAVKEGDLVLRDAIDDQLRVLKASGEIDHLYQKWFAALGGNTPGVGLFRGPVPGL